MRTDIYQFEDLSMAISGVAREGDHVFPECTISCGRPDHAVSVADKDDENHATAGQDEAAWLLQRAADVLMGG